VSLDVAESRIPFAYRQGIVRGFALVSPHTDNAFGTWQVEKELDHVDAKDPITTKNRESAENSVNHGYP